MSSFVRALLQPLRCLPSRMDTPGNSRKHIVFLPFAAFGHIIPMLEMAKKLSVFHDITFAVAAGKADLIRKRELLSNTDNIRLYAIEESTRSALEENDNLGQYLQDLVDAAIPSVKHFSRLFRSPRNPREGVEQTELQAVDLVIADNFVIAPIITPVCCQENIPFYHFSTASSGFVAMLLMLDDNFPTKPTVDITPPLLQPPKRGQKSDPIPEYMLQRFLPVSKTIHLAKGIIIDTVRELDQPIINHITEHQKMKGKELYTVGPLFQPEKTHFEDTVSTQRNIVLDWLDKQKVNSVIYASFGTLAVLSHEQLQKMAAALIHAGKPFIWSLPTKVHHLLPPEFQNKSDSSATAPFLVLDWVPQKTVLEHPSTALFLSHCGWNSTLEALTSGVPVVCWPLFGDQLMNALRLTESGVGVLVDGTGVVQNNLIQKEVIVGAIVEASQEKYRSAADNWSLRMKKAIGSDGTTTQDIGRLLAAIADIH